MNVKRNIGIFGGSFNPIHVGHISLAKSLLEKARLDEIWFVVSPLNPFKKNSYLLDDEKRLEMVRIALKDEPKLIASDYEFHLPRPSYMLNTLNSMADDYPEASFTLLIGGDNWTAFDRWYGYKEIMTNYKIVIYPRRGSNINIAELPDCAQLVDTPLLDISSTEIRRMISEGNSVRGMVPQQIEEMVVAYYTESLLKADTK